MDLTKIFLLLSVIFLGACTSKSKMYSAERIAYASGCYDLLHRMVEDPKEAEDFCIRYSRIYQPLQ